MNTTNTSSPNAAAVVELPDDFPLMFHITDQYGTILRVSDMWLDTLGYAREEVIGRRNVDFLCEDSAAEATARMTDFFTEGRAYGLRYKFRCKDGGLQACELSAYVLRDVQGQPTGSVAVVHTIAGEEAVVAHLMHKSFRLQSCLEGTNAGTWEWNVQTGETRFNERWAEIVGYRLDELHPISIDTWLSLSHPADLDKSADALKSHWEGRSEFYDIEARMRHKDGYWVWVHDRGRVFTWTSEGEPEWMFGTHFSLDDERRQASEAARMQRLMRRSGQAAGIGGWELDLETNELTWTEETRRIHGVDESYVPTVEQAITFYAPEARPIITKAVELGLAEGRSWDIELPFIPLSGERIWVRTLGDVEFLDGKPRRLFGAFQDITDRVHQKEALAQARKTAQEAQNRLWAAIEALPEAFVLFDAEDRAAMFNAKYRKLYADSANAIQIGQKFESILREGLLNAQYPDAVGREEEWLSERLERHRNPAGPIEQELPGDRHLQIHEARLANGDTVGFRVDVTELKRQKKELVVKARALEVAATTDPLTGLKNRRGLEAVMTDLAESADDGAHFGLLHVDLDRFKPINDVFGHPAGDHLLQRVAIVLTANVRSVDHVARVGGDEFVVILNAPCDAEHAQQVAERIIAQCSEAVAWQDKTLHFGASVGIALGTVNDLPMMLHNADIALYEAKKGGRNRHHVFNSDLRQQIETRKALSDDLLAGLGRGEIVAFYQPQVRAEDGSLAGFEALARWQHPDRGLLLPSDFLELADDLGVICEIDRLICDQAIETGLEMVSEGHALSQVAVNAGLRRLTQAPDFDWLPKTVELPFRLGLEILEAVDVDRNFDEIGWVFDGLRERGVLIEIDDFGSGRASLTSLLKIRPDRIKLDIQIVRAAMFDRTGAGSMVRAIAEMCRGLDIPMTAEGIETQKHAVLMRDMGCDILQGFHFAKPLSREDLISWGGKRAIEHAISLASGA